MTTYEKRFLRRARQWAAFTKAWGEAVTLACAIERAEKLLWQMAHGVPQHLIANGRPYQYCRMVYQTYAGRKA